MEKSLDGQYIRIRYMYARFCVLAKDDQKIKINDPMILIEGEYEISYVENGFL